MPALCTTKDGLRGGRAARARNADARHGREDVHKLRWLANFAVESYLLCFLELPHKALFEQSHTNHSVNGIPEPLGHRQTKKVTAWNGKRGRSHA